jgi:hypothetical protein
MFQSTRCGTPSGDPPALPGVTAYATAITTAAAPRRRCSGSRPATAAAIPPPRASSTTAHQAGPSAVSAAGTNQSPQKPSISPERSAIDPVTQRSVYGASSGLLSESGPRSTHGAGFPVRARLRAYQ